MKRLGFLIVASLSFAAVLPVHAFEIQPAIIDVAADSGTRQQVNIRLRNDDSETVTYYVTVEKFLPSGENGQQIFLGTEDTKGLPEWTFVDAPSVTLRPNESINFPVSLRIPPNTPAGVYMESIFFSPIPAGSLESVITTAPRIGALLFVTVTGQVTSKLSLESFVVNHDSNDQLPVDFSVRLRNDGNGISVPDGEIRIRNVFGSVVAKLPINTDAKRILPNSVRAFPVSWEKDAFAFGPYTATLFIPLDETLGSSVSFSVWPWRMLLWGIGGLIILIILYFIVKRIIIRRSTV